MFGLAIEISDSDVSSRQEFAKAFRSAAIFDAKVLPRNGSMGNCVCAQLRTRADQQPGEGRKEPNFGPDPRKRGAGTGESGGTAKPVAAKRPDNGSF
jgi:hypothetical protein